MGKPSGNCLICSTLQPAHLMELDMLLADPLRWPSTIWGNLPAPANGMPASYRRWGGEQLAKAWLADNGYPGIRIATIRQHFRFDVPHIARTADELADVGLIVDGPASDKLPVNPALDPMAFMRYFNSGILVGEAALMMLVNRINSMEEQGIPVPTDLLLELTGLATGLAKAQASLVQKGMKLGDGPDENDGFRTAKADAPDRIGKTTVRNVDGQRTAIHDEGRADREAWQARTRVEGGPALD